MTTTSPVRPPSTTARSFGVEEELVFLDRAALRPVPAAQSVLGLMPDSAVREFVTPEYLASQLEYSSPVHTTVADAMVGLQSFRTVVREAAADAGVVVAATGVPFDVDGDPEIAAIERYERVASANGAVATDHQITALHVHVGIASADDGIRALNRVRVWIPVLLALGSNSPFWRGRDTGFASWRNIHMRRWTTSGCPPVFADGADYWKRAQQLVGVGGTTDINTIAWNVRLSVQHPTIEFRVFDAQLATWQSTFLAALCRGLVTTALSAEPWPALSSELLDSALWHASRDGMTGSLVNPQTGALEPAADVARALVASVAVALESTGDLSFVTDGLARLLASGTGAAQQRAAFASGGVAGLARLFDEGVA